MPMGYVVNADTVPVILSCGPLHPVVKVHVDEQVGQFVASPYVFATMPVAAHCATVTSVHELAPAIEDDPIGHVITVDEPTGQ
jgi:hypothetical protein